MIHLKQFFSCKKVCLCLSRGTNRRTGPIFPPIKRRYIVSPKRHKQTVWSTALGLHLDSIKEEDCNEPGIRDR